MTTGQVASREEVEAFLAETEFNGYQEVPLPQGLRVPGESRTKRADQVFSISTETAGRSDRHLRFFDEISFARSVSGKRRVVAHCRVART